MSRSSLLLVVWLGLAGCSTYKLDIPQGNIVTEDMAARLKPGMTRAQVRSALGTPLFTDPFHADRWDYVYRKLEDGKEKDKRHLTLWFKGDALQRWEGSTLPAAKAPEPAAEPVAAPAAATPAASGSPTPPAGSVSPAGPATTPGSPTAP